MSEVLKSASRTVLDELQNGQGLVGSVISRA